MGSCFFCIVFLEDPRVISVINGWFLFLIHVLDVLFRRDLRKFVTGCMLFMYCEITTNNVVNGRRRIFADNNYSVTLKLWSTRR